MINTQLLDKEYDKYKLLKDKYNSYKEELEKIKITDYEGLEDVLRIYRDAKKEKKNISEEVLSIFLEKYPIIARIDSLENLIITCKSNLDEHFLFTKTFDDFGRFIALKHINDNEFDLINLNTQETLDLSQYDQDKQNYILEDLKKKNSFIGSITRDELPLLMNILEDMDIEIDYSDMDPDDVAAEAYYVEISKCYEMFLEIRKTRAYDEGNLIYHQNLANMLSNFNEELQKLKQNKKNISEEDYWNSFYRLKILSGENIEKMYLEAEESHKKHIINAYYKLSTPSEYNTKEEKCLQLRTASSIINQEVLKRKILIDNN